LLEEEDAEIQDEKCLIKCLQSCAWLKGAPKAMDRVIRGLYKKAVRSGLPAMAVSKIKSFRRIRQFVPLVLLKKNTQMIECTEEIGDEYFTPEEMADAARMVQDLMDDFTVADFEQY